MMGGGDVWMIKMIHGGTTRTFVIIYYLTLLLLIAEPCDFFQVQIRADVRAYANRVKGFVIRVFIDCNNPARR
jgi:hypothetical protein